MPKKRLNDNEGYMTNIGELPVAGGDFVLPVADAVAATAVAGFDSQSEEALALRYGRLRRRAQKEIVFQYTRDPGLLQQYYDLYERECRVVDSPTYSDAEREYNNKGHVMVVRQGNMCIGGARLSARTPRQPKRLPMEIGDFQVKNHFPHLEQKQLSYGELSRLVLLPEFRTGDITQLMFFHLYRKSVALDLSVVYAAAPRSNLRIYRQHFLTIGLKETKIHYDIDIPPYPGFEEIKDYLFSVTIDKTFLPEMEKTIPTENLVCSLEEV